MSLVLAAILAAGPNPFLPQALEHEQNLDFERCVERLKQAATQWQSTPDELREIELHAGLCKFNLGQRKAAAEHFRTALRIDEGAELPPYTSPKAVELFLEVKLALRAPPPPLPESDLPDDAPTAPKLTPRPVAPPAAPFPPPALARRAVPLGLGLLSLAGFTTGVVLGLRAQGVARDANGASFEADFFRLGEAARGLATGSTVAWISGGLFAAGALLTWFLTDPPPSGATALNEALKGSTLHAAW